MDHMSKIYINRSHEQKYGSHEQIYIDHHMSKGVDHMRKIYMNRSHEFLTLSLANKSGMR